MTHASLLQGDIMGGMEGNSGGIKMPDVNRDAKWETGEGKYTRACS